MPSLTQTTFNAINNKVGRLGSTDFVSSDSMSKIPIEDVTAGLKALVRKVRNASPVLSATQLKPKESSPIKRQITNTHFLGNKLPQMIKLRSDTFDDSSKL